MLHFRLMCRYFHISVFHLTSGSMQMLLLPGHNTEGERRWLLYCRSYHAWWHDSQTRFVCSLMSVCYVQCEHKCNPVLQCLCGVWDYLSVRTKPAGDNSLKSICRLSVISAGHAVVFPAPEHCHPSGLYLITLFESCVVNDDGCVELVDTV